MLERERRRRVVAVSRTERPRLSFPPAVLWVKFFGKQDSHQLRKHRAKYAEKLPWRMKYGYDAIGEVGLFGRSLNWVMERVSYGLKPFEGIVWQLVLLYMLGDILNQIGEDGFKIFAGCWSSCRSRSSHIFVNFCLLCCWGFRSRIGSTMGRWVIHSTR